VSIPFTQYLRPDGRRTDVSIDRPADVEAMANVFISAGGCFECEELLTGHASLTAVFPLNEGPEDIAIEVVPNGPPVEAAVDRLVASAVDWLAGRPA
jgi:hypothetical protein